MQALKPTQDQINEAILEVEYDKWLKNKKWVFRVCNKAIEIALAEQAIKQPEPVAIGMRDAIYKDSTPKLHVGDSSFENWFQAQPFATQVGIKQMCRDSYAAGMGDPLVTYAAPSEPVEPEICTIKNLDTGIISTITREAAKKLWDELGYTVEWFSGVKQTRFPADQILSFDDTKDGRPNGEPAIYTYKLKGTVKLKIDDEPAKMLTPEQCEAERLARVDTHDVEVLTDGHKLWELADSEFLSAFEYRLIRKQPKQVSWNDVPVGVAVTYEGVAGFYVGSCIDRDGESSREVLFLDSQGYGKDLHTFDDTAVLKLAPASEQPWIAVQDDDDFMLKECFEYDKRYNAADDCELIAFRITGIAEGWVLK